MANNQQSDFYVNAAATRANQIEAELAACRADLAAHRANGDVDSAAVSVQQIANLTAEQQNLGALYQGYISSINPPPPELTAEEKAAKPWNRMTYADAYELAKGSKFGVDDEAFRQGMAEVQRRRARGE